MTEDFNQHDAKAATRMYLADADLVTVRGEVLKGAAEMEKGLAAIFATRARDAKLATLDVAIRFVRPDEPDCHIQCGELCVPRPRGKDRGEAFLHFGGAFEDFTAHRYEISIRQVHPGRRFRIVLIKVFSHLRDDFANL